MRYDNEINDILGRERGHGQPLQANLAKMAVLGVPRGMPHRLKITLDFWGGAKNPVNSGVWHVCMAVCMA